MPSIYPQTFTDLNASDTKNLNVVVEIEGSPYTFSLVQSYKRIRYGDSDLFYGDSGIVYGGLKAISSSLPILSPNSNLTISQKIEPEQGRGSSATLSLEFVDLDGFMSNFVSPGQVLDEILGGKQIKIYMGFQNSSFKEDYFVVFRGYVSMVTYQATKIILQITDANIKRKQQIFFAGKTKVSGRLLEFPNTDFDDLNDKINLIGHGFGFNNVVQLVCDGSLPSGLTQNVNYYVVNQNEDDFQLSETPGGTVINFAGQGSGTTSVFLVETGVDSSIIWVDKTDGFPQSILGPNDNYDESFFAAIRVNDELMNYQPNDLYANSIIIERGFLDSTPASHKPGDDVSSQFVLQGNVIDLALKVMLSGFNGPYIENISVESFGYTSDPTLGVLPNCITLPDGVDAVSDYGLAVGDYVYIAGSASNDGTYTIASFADANEFPNKLIVTNEPTIQENTTSAVMAARSQYDTLPPQIASGLKPTDVDVATWQNVKELFAFQADSNFEFLITQPESGKEWIESQLLLPTGLYGITRFGRIAVSATKPPVISTDLVILDNTNIKNPQNITVTRGINNRRFFNEIQYKYDYSKDDKELNVLSIIDTNSLNKFDTSSVLPITAKGLRSAIGADTFTRRRGGFILRRYANAAYEIELETNFEAAAQIEVSDVVALYDNGDLKIINFDTGQRDLGSQLFEVIQRSLDIKSGTGRLTLMSQINYQITDKFATISPSSKVGPGATTSSIPIKVSYGGKFLTQEWKKYEPIVGDEIRVHSEDYSSDYTTQLIGFDATNKNILIVSPLPAVPSEDWIIDLAPYDPSNSAINQKSKLLFAYIDPTLTVVSGLDAKTFTVSAPDAAQISVGNYILIHNDDYSLKSSEALVADITGTTITLETDIEFVPLSGYKIELVGFTDGGGAYRIL